MYPRSDFAVDSKGHWAAVCDKRGYKDVLRGACSVRPNDTSLTPSTELELREWEIALDHEPTSS